MTRLELQIRARIARLCRVPRARVVLSVVDCAVFGGVGWSMTACVHGARGHGGLTKLYQAGGRTRREAGERMLARAPRLRKAVRD